MTTEDRRPIRRALISVYDKTGLPELVHGLAAAGVEIVSTGNTAALVESLGYPVTRVEELTGFPECLDGRVKSLHPAIHAGLLADLRIEAHREQLRELGIEPFDLLVSNLYPFAETVASGADLEECIEKIDIGGPAMVRAAAKNHANVAVVTSPAAYDLILRALAEGGTTLAERRRLAASAYADIATYDVEIARWSVEHLVAAEPAGQSDEDRPWPEYTGISANLVTTLRYGENPHQKAAVYAEPRGRPGLAQAQQLGGKEMSYNNFVDADAAWRACHDFTEPAVAIIKHANPCGIAVGADVAEAHRKAHACDPVSAYGGVIAVNAPVTVQLATQIAEIFTEVVIAPSYEDGAVEILTRKKNLRVLVAPEWRPSHVEWRQISGGVLVQTADRIDAPGDDPSAWRLVAGEPVTGDALADLAFAWRAVRSVKSNAILLARDRATVGVGMGQVNRVDSARLAVARAGERARGCVAASDAFFPFPDGLEVLAEAGVSAVAQPGGSVRDEEVIAAAVKAGITMYFTGTRHFFH
ncbi:MAG TPA: bifunctional phosphoribosylaminoimidazolecarboxamide formyltransferase/IMP cyclohydrolase [Micromonosporaceae bacterium]|nr:bifunctional phosphoribosylaminoimidazolecarboxamide formyltransferase/IMP cyclohydrolase [Micromonosporaceae bacterium]